MRKLAAVGTQRVEERIARGVLLAPPARCLLGSRVHGTGQLSPELMLVDADDARCSAHVTGQTVRFFFFFELAMEASELNDIGGPTAAALTAVVLRRVPAPAGLHAYPVVVRAWVPVLGGGRGGSDYSLSQLPVGQDGALLRALRRCLRRCQRRVFWRPGCPSTRAESGILLRLLDDVAGHWQSRSVDSQTICYAPPPAPKPRLCSNCAATRC